MLKKNAYKGTFNLNVDLHFLTLIKQILALLKFFFNSNFKNQQSPPHCRMRYCDYYNNDNKWKR